MSNEEDASGSDLGSDSDSAASADSDILVEIPYNGGSLTDVSYRNQWRTIVTTPFRCLVDLSVTVIDDHAFFFYCKWEIQAELNFRDLDPNCKNCMQEIVFHNNVTSIGHSACNQCRNLQQISLPENLERIGWDAFSMCSSLHGTIVVPKKVKYVGRNVFARCDSLECDDFSRTKNIQFEDGGHVFARSSSLRSVIFSKHQRIIPYGCFQSCTSLVEINHPLYLRQIKEYAFDSCSSLVHFELTKNIEYVSPRAFLNCTALECVTIRSTKVQFDKFNNVNGGVFEGCSALSSIKVYPWLWPRIFSSMKNDPDFIFKMLHKYQNHILNFVVVSQQHHHDEQQEYGNRKRNRTET